MLTPFTPIFDIYKLDRELTRLCSGKFRNMIQSSIIPRATARHQLTGFGLSQQSTEAKSLHDAVSRPGLYEEEDEDLAPYSTTLSSSLGLSLPNPAPTVELQATDEGKKSLLVF